MQLVQQLCDPANPVSNLWLPKLSHKWGTCTGSAFLVVVYFEFMHKGRFIIISSGAWMSCETESSPGTMWPNATIPKSCFVGQSCQPQFQQGHKQMTNWRHTLLPAESKTLAGARLLGINFVLSAVFGGVWGGQTMPKHCWLMKECIERNASRPCFVLLQTKKLQKMFFNI